jgi:hypothetical protein
VTLNYTGTDKLAGISFDGGVTYQPLGTYGAVGSGATHTSAAFSGSGILQVATYVPPQFLKPVLSGVNIILSWTGSGQLLQSTNVNGPWTAISGATTSPHSETIVPNQNRFYKLQGL